MNCPTEATLRRTRERRVIKKRNGAELSAGEAVAQHRTLRFDRLGGVTHFSMRHDGSHAIRRRHCVVRRRCRLCLCFRRRRCFHRAQLRGDRCVSLRLVATGATQRSLGDVNEATSLRVEFSMVSRATLEMTRLVETALRRGGDGGDVAGQGDARLQRARHAKQLRAKSRQVKSSQAKRCVFFTAGSGHKKRVQKAHDVHTRKGFLSHLYFARAFRNIVRRHDFF